MTKIRVLLSKKQQLVSTAKQIKQTPLKIEVIGTAEGFKVTDDQGVVYIYGGNSDYTIETSACKQVYL